VNGVFYSIPGTDLFFADAGNNMSFGSIQSRGQNPQDILGDVSGSALSPLVISSPLFFAFDVSLCPSLPSSGFWFSYVETMLIMTPDTQVFLKCVYAVFDQTPGAPRIGFGQR
jgi:hypothetical protein